MNADMDAGTIRHQCRVAMKTDESKKGFRRYSQRLVSLAVE